MRHVQLFLCLVLLNLPIGLVRAQLAQAVRVEVPADPNEAEAFDVLPLAERGLLMTVRTGGIVDNTPTRFHFQRFDKNLKLIWKRKVTQDIRFRPLLSYHNEQYEYHLLRNYDSNEFEFLQLNLDDGSVETHQGHLLDQFDVQQFKVMGSQAYVGGYRHGRPVVMSFSFFDHTAKVLPGMYVNNMELNSVEVDDARREINVLVHSSRRRCTFSIRTYNYDGKLTRTVDFNDPKHNLISGKLLPINEQESMLVGNYSTDCTPFSQGIYVTRIRHTDSADAADEAARNIRYVEFSQLQNFFNYLKPNRQQKILAKAQKKKEEGKDYKFRYRLLVHDLQPSPNGLTLIAEVYYPQYRGNSIMYGGYLRGADRYDGFRFTHAFVCGFDKQGNLLWDNCLPIKELVSPDLAEMVQLSQQDDRMVLAYPNDGQITTSVIQGSEVLRQTETFKLQTNIENERVTFSAQENVMAWYDRYFLACGFQKIAQNRPNAPQREVFYLNKLTYSINAPAKPAEATTRKNDGPER
ncbi:hypothetical protein [Spirosoma montaniterrae]|uniref:Uncharacterized protein n=1 Tax=Spirosoma montaniterrae TaxID=1178516 RepID=A0A1P9WXH9_9BACT|nr:hypothetical protein [Spirosoma montaniterrae]AQG80102.1 hypothetical protein AWR27_12655 [Spirosoma montaniterrae]